MTALWLRALATLVEDPQGSFLSTHMAGHNDLLLQFEKHLMLSSALLSQIHMQTLINLKENSHLKSDPIMLYTVCTVTSLGLNISP